MPIETDLNQVAQVQSLTPFRSTWNLVAAHQLLQPFLETVLSGFVWKSA